MSSHYLDSYLFAQRSQKQIKTIGWMIGIGWVGASVAASVTGNGLPAEQQPALVYYALGHHHYSQGFLPVQLLTYSFIHTLNLHLVLNLITLHATVNISRLCLTPAAFIRLYSLGSILGGLVFLLMSASAAQPQALIGAGTALMAMIGAVAVLQPQVKILFFVIPMRLLWVPLIQLAILLYSVKSNPALSMGLIAGLIAGVIYGLAERMWKRLSKDTYRT